jgi:ADP-ribose pyrophosphatase
MKPWKTIKRDTILHNRWLTVENHTVELPDGRQIEGWQWVVVPDYINVLALTPEEKFICFRQTKYAVTDTSLAPVGGIIEDGEAPLEAAKRELREELGYEAEDWIFLGKYATEANRGVGVGYIYLARNAIFVGKRSSDDLEEQELVELCVDEMRSALVMGEFKVISWAATVGLALAYLKA